ATRTAAGNRGSLGDVSCQLSSNEISNYRPVAARAVVDQGDGFRALMHRNLAGNRLITHGSKHGMAGAVGDVAGAPLVGAAEGTLGDQAVGCIALGDGDFLTVDDDLAIAPLHATPRQAPRRQLAYRFGCSVDEHPHDFLVGAPIAAAHRIFEVHVLVVT